MACQPFHWSKWVTRKKSAALFLQVFREERPLGEHDFGKMPQIKLGIIPKMPLIFAIIPKMPMIIENSKNAQTCYWRQRPEIILRQQGLTSRKNARQQDKRQKHNRPLRFENSPKHPSASGWGCHRLSAKKGRVSLERHQRMRGRMCGQPSRCQEPKRFAVGDFVKEPFNLSFLSGLVLMLWPLFLQPEQEVIRLGISS